MKPQNLIFLFACLAALLFASCGGGSDEPGEEPSVPSITFASGVDTKPVIAVEGGTVSVGFTATAAWTATVRDGSAWLSVSPASGEAGAGTVSITAKANDGYDERNAAVVLTCGTATQTITVTQKQKDALTVTTGKVELEAEGGAFSIELKTNVSVTCEVEAEAQSWLKAAADTRALQDRTLNFEAAPNEDKENRQAVITLKGGDLQETVTVYQAGSAPVLVLTQQEYVVGSEGESIKVELKSNTNYTMQLPAEANWITEIVTRGMSSYTHNFAISPNDTYDSRTARILFINQEDGIEEAVTVTQLQKDAIIVAQSEYEVPASGGVLDFKLQANVELEVSVSVDWITEVVLRTRALTDRMLCFDIQPNEDTENGREGTITLKGKESEVTQTITVKQARKVSIVIDGDKATIDLGTDADAAKQAIADAAAQGVKNFTLNGNYETLRLTTDNPFKNIDVETLDMSGVTGWPVTDGLAEIPAQTFNKYTNIQEVILPAEVQVVGRSAFAKCSALKRVEAPGVQQVNGAAFQDCTSLEEAVLPEVISIEGSGFSFSGIKKVDFPKLTTLAGSVFWFCSSLTEVNLPEAVTIGEASDGTESSRYGTSVFADCTNLQKVNLPKAVEIGESAFNSCKLLTEIDLPMAEKIGSTTFRWCSSLTVIRLPRVTEIRGNHNFGKCPLLTTLYLTAPGNISMGTNCFGSSSFSSQVDLYLNADKEDELKEGFMGSLEWKRYSWKSVTFVE